MSTMAKEIPCIPQENGDTAGAPFHIVGVRAKEEDVDVTHCGHRTMVPVRTVASIMLPAIV